MKLECKHVWEYISDYIDESIAPDLRQDIESHLEHCEICSAVWATNDGYATGPDPGQRIPDFALPDQSAPSEL